MAIYHIWVGAMLENAPADLNNLNLNQYLSSGSINVSIYDNDIKQAMKKLGGTALKFDTESKRMSFVNFLPYGTDTARYFYNDDNDLRSNFVTSNGSYARARQPMRNERTWRESEFLFCNTANGAYIRTYSAGCGSETILNLAKIDQIRFGE
jgi:hypothetical protein